MRTLWQDLRYGARMLMKRPGFTLAAIFTFVLGIGANTAIFSLVDAFMLRLLPVKDPQQLVIVESVSPEGRPASGFSYSTFEQYHAQSRAFSGMFAWDEFPVSIAVENQPEIGQADFVTGDYFSVLGVSAFRGRTLTADDDAPGKEAVAVISHSFWQRRLGGDPAIVGKTIHVGKIPITLVGVTAPNFYGRAVAGRAADVVLPMFMRTNIALADRGVQIMARLKPGISPEQARTELDMIYQQTLLEEAAQAGRQMRARRVELKPGSSGTPVSSDFAAALRILLMVVGLVLLIACVNVANLSLARAATREKEMAVRLSLGASRARLLRQLLTESVMLALLGGAGGLFFAVWGVDSLLKVLSFGQSTSISFDFRLDTRILAVTGAVSLLTGILSGLAPAIAGTGIDLQAMLKGAGSGSQSRPRRYGLAKSLVIAQVALSLTLLIGAGLLLRTLRQLNAVDTGFDRDHVLTAWVSPSAIGYSQPQELRLYQQLLEQLNVTPGVQSASLSLSPIHQGAVFVGPHFFRTEGIGLLAGREFSVADTASSPKVAILSESLARKFFPNENPIGQRFEFQSGGGFSIKPGSGDIRVVGIARDIKPSLWEQEWLASFYFPYTQAPPKAFGQAELLIHTTSKAISLIPAIRQGIQSVEKDLALANIKTQAEEMNEKYLGRVQPVAMLLSFFAVLALILTLVGIYGVVSFAVEQRTQELGIRRALGAQAGDVLWLVIGQGMKMAIVGIAVGLFTSVALTRLIEKLLFGVSATDPLTFVGVALLLSIVALLACWIPARRATKVDPLIAIKYE